MDACTTSPSDLDIANLTTLHLTVRQDDRLPMPEHAGSMLRGAFGVALRSLTCVTALDECRACPLKQFCQFPRLFETPALQSTGLQAVNPYVIHPPVAPKPLADKNDNAAIPKTVTYKKGDTWQFAMTIMGAATREIELIIKAWQLALQTGLGAHQPYKRATLMQVNNEGRTLYGSSVNSSANSFVDKKPLSSTANTLNLPIAITSQAITLTLQFLTPFRYQQDNRIVSRPEDLDSTTFIASLYNRIRLCQDNHSPDQPWDIGYDGYHQFRDDIAALNIKTDVSANQVSRRSNRQQRKMQLYGLQGQIHLTGNRQRIMRLLPVLQLGERLHIGKNTTMGLGQYQLRFAQPTN